MSTTTDAVRTESVPAGRTELFACPVWLAELHIDAAELDTIVADIEQRLDEHRADGVAGQHTGSVFQDRDEPRWTDFHAALFAVTDHLARTQDGPWTERFVRTWAVRYERLDDYRAGETHLHSHMGKTFACIFTLRLPTSLVGTTAAATVVRNPQANLRDITGAASEWHGPATTLSGVVFPAVLEHQAELPPTDEQWDGPRLVLVSDVAYY